MSHAYFFAIVMPIAKLIAGKGRCLLTGNRDVRRPEVTFLIWSPVAAGL